MGWVAASAVSRGHGLLAAGRKENTRAYPGG